MSIQRKARTGLRQLNSESIRDQYMVPYGANNLSRYKHIDELLLDNGDLIKATLGPVDLSVYPVEDSFTLYPVRDDEVNRIDIIAYKVYGQASMWWAIAYANKLRDPLDIPYGRTLLIPSLSMLKRFPNPLS